MQIGIPLLDEESSVIPVVLQPIITIIEVRIISVFMVLVFMMVRSIVGSKERKYMIQNYT